MVAQETSPPRVFISYSHDSEAHKAKVLAFSEQLRADGIDAWIDQYSPDPDEGWPRWMGRQIEEADFVLMVCTETYYRRLTGEEEPDAGRGVFWESSLIYNDLYEQKIATSKYQTVLFEDGKEDYLPPPLRNHSRFWVDSQEGYEDLYRLLTGQPRVVPGAIGALKKLKQLHPLSDRVEEEPSAAEGAAEEEGKFFISYAHGDPDEENLAASLNRRLAESGHETFIDKKIKAGTDWLEEIQEGIRWCDYLVVLLSEISMDSEMVLEEVRIARRIQRQEGKPRIIPVRVHYQGPLEYELHNHLGHLQYVTWEGEEDTEQVLQELHRAMETASGEAEEPSFAERLRADQHARLADPVRPQASADARVLFVPGGNVRLADPYYIRRAVDDQAEMLATQPYGETLVIKGPRQMGKSSLLVRYLLACKDAGKKEAFVDFSRFSTNDFKDYSTFLSRLALALQQRLRLEGDEPVIDSQFDMVAFVENQILAAVDGPLVIAFDEVDRVYRQPYQTDFFTMLRNWHNNRSPLDPQWEVLDLALVISTEPYLLIDSTDRSPFNVGLVLEMTPFTKEEHQQLCARYDLNVDEDELWGLLRGHPYLTRLAFYRLAGPEKMPFDELIEEAGKERGSFGDHLRALLSKLQDYPDLLGAMRQVRYGERPEDDLYYRLYGAGLVREEGDRVNPANGLYDLFFKKAL